jgi:3-hydroxyisobutyrate dehydrogenase
MANIAFIGTGLLGAGMVEAMRRHGHQVTVWNRTRGKADALAALGAIVAATPPAAAAGADRVHFALPDDAVVDAMLEKIAGALTPGAVVVDHSTTLPATTAARVKSASSRGISFLHAPVFMSPQMCRDCTGVMIVSGPQAVFDPVRGALEQMTGEVWYVGERGDLAAAYKIFGNSMIFVITAGLADVMAMARATGVPALDAAALFSKFKAGSVLPSRAQKIAAGDATVTFELAMARKDIGLMIEAAGGQPLVVLPAIAARMDQAIRDGHGREDMGAVLATAPANT